MTMDNPFTQKTGTVSRRVRWIVIGLVVVGVLAVGIGIGIVAGSPSGSDAEDSSTGGNRGLAVTVLNNSTEPVLSQAGAERIRDSGWQNVGYGNLQGRIVGISEEPRVYYPADDAGAQEVAENIAAGLGLTAAPGNTDYYDRFGEASIREGSAADCVVVVLTGPLR